MGILDRVSLVIKSNINHLINKAEDPEKMLDQMLIQMREQLGEAQREVAVTIADEKRLGAQAEAELEQVQEWDRKATLAVEKGDDELAREALRRKSEHERIGADYKKQWDAQKASTENLKNALRALSQKIEEAGRKKNLLIARQKRAEAQKHIQEVMTGLTDTSAFETFDRMAGRVDQLEAQAAAATEISGELTGDTLDQRFKALEGSTDVDEALKALKAKVQQKQLPASS